MNDGAYALQASPRVKDHSLREVEPLSENLPTSLTEAIVLLEESRIQAIELKIMLDAAENFVNGADERDRQAHAALTEMREALVSERNAHVRLADELDQLRDSGTHAEKEVAALLSQGDDLRRQLSDRRAEGDRLHAELAAQQGRFEQLRQASREAGDGSTAELLAQVESERTIGEQLRAELAEERAAYEELNSNYAKDQAAWNRSRNDGNVSDEKDRLQARIAELESTLRLNTEKQEIAIAAQLREVQRSNEAERTTLARLKGLEQELSILQARASMLAARSEPDRDRNQANEEKPGGLMSRFVGRLRGRRSDDDSNGDSSA